MNVTLGKGRFAARISSLGAELQSLVDTETGTEYIWQADPSWWKASAPVLFPIVGALKDNRYRFDGREYELPPHGFARGSEFSVVAAAGDSSRLELVSGPQTGTKYPFDFGLIVTFTVEGAGISVRYDVRNTGASLMYFSIGSHPAFNLPFAGGALEDYFFEFGSPEKLERHYYTDNLVVAGKTSLIIEDGRRISFTKSLFDEGCLIFKAPASKRFSLRNRLNPRSLTVSTEGSPYLGLWSKPNGAPFVCIEPWHGLPDSTDSSGELSLKEGILSLEPGSGFLSGYRVEIA